MCYNTLCLLLVSWPLSVCRDFEYLANTQQAAVTSHFKRLANFILLPRADIEADFASCWFHAFLSAFGAFCTSLNEQKNALYSSSVYHSASDSQEESHLACLQSPEPGWNPVCGVTRICFHGVRSPLVDMFPCFLMSLCELVPCGSTVVYFDLSPLSSVPHPFLRSRAERVAAVDYIDCQVGRCARTLLEGYITLFA